MAQKIKSSVGMGHVKVPAYLKNVGKSLGYTIGEALKSYNPVIVGTAKEVAETSQNAYQTIKAFFVPDENDEIAVQKWASIGKNTVKDIFKNTKEDLLSGRFYNRERIEAAESMAMGFDAGEFGFDDSDWGDDWGDSDLGDDWGENDDTSITIDAEEKSAQEIVRSVNTSAKAATMTTVNAIMESAEYTAEVSQVHTGALIGVNQKGFGETISALNSINNTIGAFAKLGEPLTAHMQNSAVFFTKTTDTLDNIYKSLQNIEKNTTQAPAISEKEAESSRKTMSNFLTDEGFSIDAYKDFFISNLKDWSGFANMIVAGFGDDKSFFQKVKEMDKNGSFGKNTSLMKYAMEFLGGALIPKVISSAMQNFNTTLQDAMAAGITRLREYGQPNLLTEMIKENLLPDDNLKKTINTSLYEQGKVAWDGISRQSLVQVIPEYLSRILYSLSGKNVHYDYNKGIFMEYGAIKKEDKNKIKEAAYAAGGEFRTDLIEKANRNKKLSKEERAAQIADINKYFETAFDTGSGYLKVFNDNFAQMYDLNQETVDLLRSQIREYRKSNDIDVRNRANKLAVEIPNAREAYSTQTKSDELKGISNQNYLLNEMEDIFKDVAPGKIYSNKHNPLLFEDESKHSAMFYIQGIYGYIKQIAENGYGNNRSGLLSTARSYIQHITGKDKQETDPTIADQSRKPGESTTEESNERLGLDDEFREFDNDEFLTEEEKAEKERNEKKEELAKSINEKVTGVRGKISQWIRKRTGSLGKLLRYPVDALGNLITHLGFSLEEIIWGKNGQEDEGGIFGYMMSKMKETFGKFTNWFDNLFGTHLGEKTKNLPDKLLGKKGEDGKRHGGALSGFANDTKDNLKSAGKWYGNAVSEVFTGKDNEDEDEGESSADTEPISGAARGRKVTKTGLVAVSKGELIIPSELNPYYKGKTNKRSQIQAENNVIRKFYGSYAEGGTVEDNNNADDNFTEKLSEKIVDKFTDLFSVVKDKLRGKIDDIMKDENAAANAVRNANTRPDTDIPEASDISDQSQESVNNGRESESKGNKEKSDAGGDSDENADDGLTEDERAANEARKKAKERRKKRIKNGEGVLGLLYTGGKEAVDSIKEHVETIVGEQKEKNANNEEAKHVKDTISQVFKDAGDNRGALGAGAIIGGGVSLLTGAIVGPLAGAAIGAGTALIMKSNTVQDIIFGKVEEDGTRQRQALYDFAMGKVPGMAKGAALGGTAGLFLGSPVIGATVGAAISYAKSSDNFKNWLFGTEVDGKRLNDGILTKDQQEMIKRNAPKIGIGAAAGGLLLGGPLGVLGGLGVGAGLGLLSSTDDFKDWLFGPEVNGKRKGGLLGTISDKILGNMNTIFRNIFNAISGWSSNLLKRTGEHISNFFKNQRDKYKNGEGGLLTKLIGGTINLGEKAVSGVTGAAGAVLGRVARRTERHNLRKGYKVYDRNLKRNMYASERLAARGGAYGSMGKADEVIANAQTTEDLDKIADMINAVKNPKQHYKESMNKAMQTLYTGLDGVDDKTMRQVEKIFRSGKINKLDSNLSPLSAEQQAQYKDVLDKVKKDVLAAQDEAGDRAGIAKKLQEFGIKATDEASLNNILKNIEYEKQNKEKFGEEAQKERKVETFQSKVTDLMQSIDEKLSKLVNINNKIEENSEENSSSNPEASGNADNASESEAESNKVIPEDNETTDLVPVEEDEIDEDESRREGRDFRRAVKKGKSAVSNYGGFIKKRIVSPIHRWKTNLSNIGHMGLNLLKDVVHDAGVGIKIGGKILGVPIKGIGKGLKAAGKGIYRAGQLAKYNAGQAMDSLADIEDDEEPPIPMAANGRISLKDRLIAASKGELIKPATDVENAVSESSFSDKLAAKIAEQFGLAMAKLKNLQKENVDGQTWETVAWTESDQSTDSTNANKDAESLKKMKMNSNSLTGKADTLETNDADAGTSFQYDMLGGIRKVSLNNQGEPEYVKNDSQTDASSKKMDQFIDSINSIPKIGLHLISFKGLFSSLKDKLLGNKDENKPSIFSKLFSALASGAKSIFGNFKSFLSKLIFGTEGASGLSLSSILKGLIGPAVIFATFKGLLDPLFKKLHIGFGNEKDEVKATSESGKTVYQKEDDNGDEYWVDEDGNIVDENVSDINVRKMGESSWKDRANANFIRGTVTGKGSFYKWLANSKFGKNSKLGQAILKSKPVTKIKSAASSFKGKVVKNLAGSADDVVEDVVENIPKQLTFDDLLKSSDDVGKAVVSNADEIAEDALEGAASGTVLTTIIAQLKKIPEALTKVVSKIPVLKNLVKPISSVTDDLAKGIAKLVQSKAGQAIKNAGKTVLKVIGPVMMALDFITGYEDARTTLSIIDEPTLPQRIISGLLRMIKNMIPIIGSMIPDKLVVDIVVKFVFPVLGYDPEEYYAQREKAEATVEEYNETHGTDYSVGDYNKAVLQDYTVTERLGNAAKSTWEDTKNGFKNIKESIKEKGIIGAAKEGISGITSSFMNAYDESGGGIGGIASGIGGVFNKMLPGILGDIMQGNMEIISLATKGKLGELWSYTLPDFSGGETNEEGITTAVPSIFSKIVGQVPLIITKLGVTPLALVSKLFGAIKNVFSGIINTVKSVVGKILEPITTAINAIKSVFSGIGKVLSSTVGKAIKTIANIGGSIKNIFSGVIGSIKNVVGKVVDGVKSFVSSVKKKVSSAWKKFKSWFTGGDSDEDKDEEYSYENMNRISSKLGLTKEEDAKNYNSYEATHAASIKLGLAKDKDNDDDNEDTNDSDQSGSGSGIVSKFSGIINKFVNKFKAKKASNSASVSQLDAQYNSSSSNYKIGSKSIAEAGSGPAVATTVSNMMGGDLNMKKAVKVANKYQTSKGTNIRYFKEALGDAGITTNQFKGGSTQPRDIKEGIQSGSPVILMGQDKKNKTKDNSPFGPNPHYVVASGMTTDGKLLIQDPENSGPALYSNKILKSVKSSLMALPSVEGGSDDLADMPNMSGGESGLSAGEDVTNKYSETVWNFFKTKGYSDAATAGIMGNFYQESTTDPTLIQNNGKGPAAGIFQWENYNKNSDRFHNMKVYAESNGYKWNELTPQIEYVDKEMVGDSETAANGVGSTSYDYWAKTKKAPIQGLDNFKNTTDVNAATKSFEMAMERAGKPMMQRRLDAAAQYYNKYNGTGGNWVAGTASTTTSNESSTAEESETLASGLLPASKTSNGTTTGILTTITNAFSNALGAILGGSSSSSSSNTSNENSSGEKVSSTTDYGTWLGAPAGIHNVTDTSEKITTSLNDSATSNKGCVRYARPRAQEISGVKLQGVVTTASNSCKDQNCAKHFGDINGKAGLVTDKSKFMQNLVPGAIFRFTNGSAISGITGVPYGHVITIEGYNPDTKTVIYSDSTSAPKGKGSPYVQFLKKSLDEFMTHGYSTKGNGPNGVFNPYLFAGKPATSAGRSGLLRRIGAGAANFFVSQKDKQYNSMKLGSSTVGQMGCGPASATMMSNLLGGRLSMEQAIDVAKKYQTSGGTDLSYFGNVLANQGIGTADVSKNLESAVKSGAPVVMLGQDSSNTSKEKSPFGPRPHYVVASGMDKNGNVVVNDPEESGPTLYSKNILKNAKYGIQAVPGSRVGGGFSGIGGGDSSNGTSSTEELYEQNYYKWADENGVDTSASKSDTTQKESTNTAAKTVQSTATTPTTSSESTDASSEDSNTSDINDIDSTGTPSSSTSSINVISTVLSAFQNALGAIFGTSSSESSGDTSTNDAYSSDSNAPTNSYGFTGNAQGLLDAMQSIKGKIRYSLTEAQDPDKGTASCASTVAWAYKKALGVENPVLSASSTAQCKDSRFTTIWQNTEGTNVPSSILQPGDIMYINWDKTKYVPGSTNMKHTEMYAGNDQDWSHGGNPKYGPVLKDLTNGRKKNVMMVRRYTPWTTTTSASGSGLESQSKSVALLNQFSPSDYTKNTDTSTIPTITLNGSGQLSGTTNKTVNKQQYSTLYNQARNTIASYNGTSQNAVSAETLSQFMNAMITLLKNIADNTIPVAKIYQALLEIQSSQTVDSTKVKELSNEAKRQERSSSLLANETSDVDENVKALVKTLAAIAKG